LLFSTTLLATGQILLLFSVSSMIVLALDTATAYTCVAILDDDALVAEHSEPSRSHSRSLLPSIEEQLGRCGLDLDDLGLIGVGLGPGSFTGIRIGLTLAKTLAFARQLPLIGVCSLDALAHNATDQETIICPAMDALKNEVYCATYSKDEHGLRRLQAPAARDPSVWTMELSENHEKVFILGSALEKYEDIFRKNLTDKLRVPSLDEQNRISAVSIGKIALEKFKESGPDDPEILEPMYCRLSEAELSRMKKHNAAP